MDFDFPTSKELEQFREEVRTFIEENAYKDPIVPPDPQKMSIEMFVYGRELQKKMGAKDWFAPGYPKKYGGGELDFGRCVVIAQEFHKIREELRWPLMTEVSSIHTGGLLAAGTEEQKKRFLPPLLNGDWYGVQAFTEPEAGSDEASMRSTAVRDGDVYVINGTKVFVGQFPVGWYPDYHYWPAVTDPKAPRHENITVFFVPAELPGITYNPLDLLVCEAQKYEIIMEDVRCPADRMIGEENKGWLVTQGTLVAEHGGGGALMPRDVMVTQLIDYCKKTKFNGKPIASDPRVQDILVQLYLEYKVNWLFGLRNFAQAQGQIPRVRYTGTQGTLHRKVWGPKLGGALLDILGPYCLTDDPELQLLLGEVEYQTRMSDVTHIAGTPEVQKIMMARAMGLGRAAAQAGGR